MALSSGSFYRNCCNLAKKWDWDDGSNFLPNFSSFFLLIGIYTSRYYFINNPLSRQCRQKLQFISAGDLLNSISTLFQYGPVGRSLDRRRYQILKNWWHQQIVYKTMNGFWKIEVVGWSMEQEHWWHQAVEGRQIVRRLKIMGSLVYYLQVSIKTTPS